jgi:endogenous inhibitor of DNA gyrase (YacG/DUF329 family)
MYLKEGGWLDTLQSAALFWTEEEKREYLDSVPSGLCPECGSPVYQNPRGRHKKFCSDTCRYAWKNKHPNQANWKSTRTAICPVCGKEFMASREYKTERKYCSHACANKGRAEERRKQK